MEHYIAEQVKAGNFPSPEAVVEDALARTMSGGFELSEEEEDEIDRAQQEIAKGKCEDFDVAAARLRKKYGI